MSVTLYAYKFKHYWLQLQHVAQSVLASMSDDLKISALKNGISMSIFFEIPNSITLYANELELWIAATTTAKRKTKKKYKTTTTAVQ